MSELSLADRFELVEFAQEAARLHALDELWTQGHEGSSYRDETESLQAIGIAMLAAIEGVRIRAAWLERAADRIGVLSSTGRAGDATGRHRPPPIRDVAVALQTEAPATRTDLETRIAALQAGSVTTGDLRSVFKCKLLEGLLAAVMSGDPTLSYMSPLDIEDALDRNGCNG
jgi:hypothetical protein